ncbi:hypothetical protein [Kineococcus terrestris]|uniref:hypothetical protein n=1 Tax=Kineococcus terrestris TaxID=2044856 RepID=UPI0034DB570C
MATTVPVAPAPARPADPPAGPPGGAPADPLAGAPATAAPALTARDVAASWGEWATAADLADEVALALRLLATRPGPAPADDRAADQAAQEAARLHLLAHEPATGLAVLDALARARPAVPSPAAPTAPAEGPRAALVAALRAAADPGPVGEQAYRWLLAGLRNGDWSASWHSTYLVGAAADQRGDLPTADEMWTRAASVHGIRTRPVVQRAAVARLARRDRTDAADSAAAAAEAAALLTGLPGGAAADVPAVAATAAALAARGDGHGAALLLAALHPEVPPGTAAGALPAGARATRAELAALDRLDAEATGAPVPAAAAAAGLGALLPLAAGAEGLPVLLAAALAAAAGAAGSLRLARQRRRNARAAARRGALRDQRRQLDRCVCYEAPVVTGAHVRTVLEHHLLPVDVPADVAADLPADLPVDPPAAGGRLAWCPRTGFLWLHRAQGTAGQALLLRGRPVAARDGEGARTPSSVPTGFYL